MHDLDDKNNALAPSTARKLLARSIDMGNLDEARQWRRVKVALLFMAGFWTAILINYLWG